MTTSFHRRLAVALACACMSVACVRGTPLFRCSAAAQCILDGIQGTCEVNGYCSFPSFQCPGSGRAYFRYSGALSNSCVPPDVTDAGDPLDASDGGDDAAESDLALPPCESLATQFCSADVPANSMSGTGPCASGACYACIAGYSPRSTSCIPTPIAYWKLDDGSGLLAADSSSDPADGTLVNSQMWMTGRVGPYCLSFNGVDNRVVVGNPAKLNFGVGSFSYGLWVYVTSSASLYDIALHKGGGSVGNPGYDMELGTGAWNAFLSDGTTLKGVTFGQELLNQWVRLVVVVDRGVNQLRAYENGALIATTDITGLGSVSSLNSVTLGSEDSGMYPFHGLLDDVLIFDRALTTTEVQALN